MHSAGETIAPNSIVTYDGLPISSGGGHVLRSRNPRQCYDQLTRFLKTCTADVAPTRFSVEVVSGNGIPDSFSAPLIASLTERFGKPRNQGLGNNTGQTWPITDDDVGDMLSLIESLEPLPVHPHGFPTICLSMLSSFQLVDPSSGAPLPNQTPAHYRHFKPGLAQLPGVSQSLARISDRTTFSLFLNFPFVETGHELGACIRFVQNHLPFQLSKSHWKRWTLTKKGDSYTGRKIAYPGSIT